MRVSPLYRPQKMVLQRHTHWSWNVQKASRPSKVPLGECKVLLKLIEAHGDDYTAMARDMRRNQLQHTAAHLRKRIAKMHEEDVEDLAERAAAAQKGAPMPPDRFARKRTGDPNNAFHKRSRNFM